MRSLRIASFLSVLAVFGCLAAPGRLAAPPVSGPTDPSRAESPTLRSTPSLITAYHGYENFDTIIEESSAGDQGGGIKENVPDKYLERYQAWKDEFLATEIGRQDWEMFARNPNFTLTITVARDNAEGAGTGKYKWDET